MLGLGEAAPAAFPVLVSIEGHGAALRVSVDGQTHELSSVLGGGWRDVTFEQPGPLEREYQIEGSDTTASNDRPHALFASGLVDSLLYRFDAWLRDESSYSRWERTRVIDLTTGLTVSSDASPLPSDFRIESALRRPEAAAHLWLNSATPDRREGLELDRDRRNARWLIERGGGTDALPRWFFPEQPAPFVAGLLNLIGRSAAAGYGLVVAAFVLGYLLRLADREFSPLALAASAARWRARPPLRGSLSKAAKTRGTVGQVAGAEAAEARSISEPVARGEALGKAAGSASAAETTGQASRFERGGLEALLHSRLFADVVLGAWLVAAGLVTTRAYHQLPHILDAMSYTFQAGLFASGNLALAVPPLVDDFRGPFEVLWQERLFSQYPPGAPAAYALGQVVGLGWLVGPLACLALIGATSWTAGVLFGPGCGLAVLGLGVLSPFVLFQAGSFLSHPIAAALLAGALAAFVAGERDGELRWYGLSGALLGAAFVTREAASLLFALPLGARLLATRRWRPLLRICLFGVSFALTYLIYNQRLTGSPWLLPRNLFNASDHFGFGDGIGFHARHTLAAGLANTDELLTILQFDLFGWPPLFALGLLGVPFLLGRARTWDVLAAAGFLAFVIAYAAYFYHGIALGPRYYFEAMPWLLLLAARGAQRLAQMARSRASVAIVISLLALNTLLFYSPLELQRRMDFSGQSGGVKISLDFVQPTLLGPQLIDVPTPSLVVTEDWWLFNTSLASLNCPELPDCSVLFALAGTPEAVSALQAQYPGRALLRAVNQAGHIELAR